MQQQTKGPRFAPRNRAENEVASEKADRLLSGHIEKQVRRLRRNDIIPDPGQPRKVFTAQDVENRRKSIEQQGQITPVEVRPQEANGKYRLLDGEVRWLAMKDFEFMDAIIITDPLTQKQILKRQIAVNVQRGGFVVADVCRSIVRLKDEFGSTHKEIAEDDFKEESKGSEKWVAKRYTTWKKVTGDWPGHELLSDMVTSLEKQKDTFTHAEYIVGVPAKFRKRLAAMTLGGATVDDLRNYVVARVPTVSSAKTSTKPSTSGGSGITIHRSSGSNTSRQTATPQQQKDTPAEEPKQTESVASEDEGAEDFEEYTEEERAAAIQAAFDDAFPNPLAATAQDLQTRISEARVAMSFISGIVAAVAARKDLSDNARQGLALQLRKLVQDGLAAVSVLEAQ